MGKAGGSVTGEGSEECWRADCQIAINIETSRLTHAGASFRESSMKLHWSPRSPFVRKVMIVAHERGVADRLTCVRTVATTFKPQAELMKDNPLSKIPTLVLDDGTVLYDSTVICEYLDALDGTPELFPRQPKARLTALRRQALGDGFLDMMVLNRNERERKPPSEAHLHSNAVRMSAILESLEREAESLTTTPFGIGHIAIGCALSYLDFRYAEENWRKGHLHLANWHASFAARTSVRATQPVDDP
jgi:glutathione S-transferase